MRALVFAPAVLIATGPCLLMGMSALALFAVNRTFLRSRHAMLWASGCMVGMLSWAMLAFRTELSGRLEHSALAIDLAALGSLLLLAEGFRTRAKGGSPPAWAMVGAGAATMVLLVSVTWSSEPWDDAVLPLLAATSFSLMASKVHVSTARISRVERVVIAILLALAALQALAGVIGLAERLDLLGSHGVFVVVLLFTVNPACAGLGLVMLMLIAFDFSVDLRRSAHTDPLTGVLNRDGFDHAARQLMARGRSRTLVRALADFDLFKRVNDLHGHEAGDATLVRVARHLAEHLGRDTAVARIGGEEFALLMPDCDIASAVARIEGARGALSHVRIDAWPGLSVTASFGVAERCRGETLPHLLERADEALYRSKRNGRDRTSACERNGPTQAYAA